MSFCLKRWRSSLIPTLGVGNVLHVGRAKSMTEKITEGHGAGKGKKDRGSFNKYL